MRRFHQYIGGCEWGQVPHTFCPKANINSPMQKKQTTTTKPEWQTRKIQERGNWPKDSGCDFLLKIPRCLENSQHSVSYKKIQILWNKLRRLEGEAIKMPHKMRMIYNDKGEGWRW